MNRAMEFIQRLTDELSVIQAFENFQATVLGNDCRNSTAARFIIRRGSSVTKFRATFNITVG